MFEGSWSFGRSATSSRYALNVLILLKVGHGLNVSITAKPLWLIPSTISSASSFGLPEKPRATKVAPLAMASRSGLIGRSGVPFGVVLVTKPTWLVGEVWPLVRP